MSYEIRVIETERTNEAGEVLPDKQVYLEAVAYSPVKVIQKALSSHRVRKPRSTEGKTTGKGKGKGRETI